jgi:hypothetical protein
MTTSAASALAQELPKPLAEIAGQNKSVLKRGDVTAEQRAYLGAGTTAERGYLVVRHSAEYLHMVDAMVQHPGFTKHGAKPLGKTGITDLGVLDEGNHRISHIYGVDKVKAAVTVFNLRAAGASVTIVDEFVNQRVLNSPASLALVIAPGTRQGIWKLTVWTDGVLYEAYIPDILDQNDRPRRSVGAVLTLAKQLITFAGIS